MRIQAGAGPDREERKRKNRSTGNTVYSYNSLKNEAVQPCGWFPKFFNVKLDFIRRLYEEQMVKHKQQEPSLQLQVIRALQARPLSPI